MAEKSEKKKLLVSMPIDTFYKLHTLCGRLMAKERCKGVSWTDGICRAVEHAYDTMRDEHGKD